MVLKLNKNSMSTLKERLRKSNIKKMMVNLNRNIKRVLVSIFTKSVIQKTLFLESCSIQIIWFWGWWKDLFTFKRRHDGKLFAIRRFYTIPWSRCYDRDASTVAYMVGPINIHIWKSGKQLFLQGRRFDNSKIM